MAAQPAPATGDKASAAPAEPSPERIRFEVELEFVQCLASPAYLNFLAQHEYFDDPDFIAYLKYLLYWKEPKYAKFIVFPHALSFLHLLQEAPFRENLKRADFSFMLHQQQGFQWQFGKTMRLRSETVNESAAGEKADPQPGPTENPQNVPSETNPSAPAAPVKPNVVDAKTTPPPAAGVQGTAV